MNEDSTHPQVEKFFLTSRTILASIFAFLVSVGSVIGIVISEEEANLLIQAWDEISVAILALVAIYGRIRASMGIRFTLS